MELPRIGQIGIGHIGIAHIGIRHIGIAQIGIEHILIFIMLSPDISQFENSADPDQLASEKPTNQDPHYFPLSCLFFLLFFLFDYLRPSQQSFSYVGTGLPGLNQY